MPDINTFAGSVTSSARPVGCQVDVAVKVMEPGFGWQFYFLRPKLFFLSEIEHRGYCLSASRFLVLPLSFFVSLKFRSRIEVHCFRN